jgi:hypothetical protein
MKIEQSESDIKTDVELDDEGNEIIEARHVAIGSQSVFKDDSRDENLESKAIDNLKELDSFDFNQVAYLPNPPVNQGEEYTVRKQFLHKF